MVYTLKKQLLRKLRFMITVTVFDSLVCTYYIFLGKIAFADRNYDFLPIFRVFRLLTKIPWYGQNDGF